MWIFSQRASCVDDCAVSWRRLQRMVVGARRVATLATLQPCNPRHVRRETAKSRKTRGHLMGVYKYIHKNLKFEICVSVLFEDATLAGPVGAFRRAGISDIGLYQGTSGSPYNIVPSVFATPIQRNRNFIDLRPAYCTPEHRRIPWKLPPEGCQLFLCM